MRQKGDYKTASKWFDEMDLDKVETFQTQYGDANGGGLKMVLPLFYIVYQVKVHQQ